MVFVTVFLRGSYWRRRGWPLCECSMRSQSVADRSEQRKGGSALCYEWLDAVRRLRLKAGECSVRFADCGDEGWMVLWLAERR